MIRWGILSTAKIARTHAIPALTQAAGCEAVAIASRNEEKAKSLASSLHIPFAFGNYETLLSSDLVDAVYIPLPTSLHVEWSLKAAQAGKHVLCEKPIAIDATDINRLHAACKRYDVIIGEAMMATSHPQWQYVRSLIKENAIGQLKLVQSSFSYFNDDPNNIRNKPKLGGGALADIGCYPIATTRFSTNRKATRAFAITERDPAFGTDILSSALIDFGHFRLSMHVATQTAWRQSACFHGTEGFIEIAAPFNAVPHQTDCVILHRDGRQDPDIFSFPKVNQYTLQFEKFAHAITSRNHDSFFDLKETHHNQMIIDAIKRSGKSERWENVL